MSVYDDIRRQSVWLQVLAGTVGLALAAGAAPTAQRAAARQAPQKSQRPLAPIPVKPPRPPAPGEVSGRVLAPDGSPVDGATVSWVTRDFDSGEAMVRTSVRTDARGGFRFTGADRLRQENGSETLLVEAAGRGFGWRDLRDEAAPPEITLAPVSEVQVTFVGPDGKPAEGLRVWPRFIMAQKNGWLILPVNARERFTRTTDSDGRCTFPALPRGAQVSLAIADERFAHLGLEDAVTVGEAEVTRAKPIRLVKGATLRGRIMFGPTGKPAPGIRVGAQGTLEGWGDAVTDANGAYHLTGLRPGAYNVALDLKGETAKSWTARAHEKLFIGEGDRREGIDFQLVRGALIRGRVTAADTGQPVQDLAIGVYGPAHPQSSAWVQRSVTGTDGTYVLRVPGGEQHVYVQSQPPPGFRKPARDAQNVVVRDGKTLAIDFQLPRGGFAGAVQGRVLGPDGAGLPGAEVEGALITDSPGPGGAVSTTAGADGRFKLDVPGPVRLRARLGTMATPKASIITEAGAVTLRLVENGLATLTGEVTDPDGKPLAGAEVDLLTWSGDMGSGGYKTATDAAGRFSYPRLWADARYSVSATAAGYGGDNTSVVEPKRGEPLKLPPLALKRADSFVAGRIVDEKGEPAPSEIYVSGRYTPHRSLVTDPQGRFRFEGVVNEELELTARASGDEWVRKRVKAGQGDVVLVRPAEGKPAAPPPPAAEPQERFGLLKGKPALPLQAVAWVNSQPLTLQALKGKVVVIDFWGIGCGPCVAALPEVQRFSDEFADRGVVVIGLHNGGTPRAEVEKFARERKLTYPIAIDAEARNSFGPTFARYTVRGIPSVAVIDRQGKIAFLDHSLTGAIAKVSELVGSK